MMKKITLIILVSLVTCLVMKAQNNRDINFDYKAAAFTTPRQNLMMQVKQPGYSFTNTQFGNPDYLAQSKKRKTVAWILIGTGGLLDIVGYAVAPKNYDAFDASDAEDVQLLASGILFIAGTACMLTSIPFFVGAGISKRKARLSVSNQKTGFVVPANVSKSITGLTMTIPIGK